MSLFPSLDNLQQQKEEPKVTGGIKITTIEFSFQSFLNKIKDGTLSDLKIQQNILNNWTSYCDYNNFQTDQSRSIFQELWTNERFLQNFCIVVPKLKTALQRFYNYNICKIAYDYQSEKDKYDDRVLGYYYNIIEMINSETIIPMTVYMPKAHAIFLVMSALGSFKLKERVDRINDFLIRSGNDFSIKDLIDIYIRLTNGKSFSPYFYYTMSYIVNTENSLEKSIYHRSTQAMLIIINSIYIIKHFNCLL